MISTKKYIVITIHIWNTFRHANPPCRHGDLWFCDHFSGSSPGQPFLRVGEFLHNNLTVYDNMDVLGRVFCKNEGLFLTKNRQF